MAIPTTTYDIATATNPSSALTDFTFIVDLSNMSAAWWAAVNTSDGTKGRASKSDGTTELACDWIDFDNVAETGILRVKYTGTLASTGTQQVRIYPPNTANTSYGVSDTYGQYNAYDSNHKLYWSCEEDPSGTPPQVIDRTSNGNDGTTIGSMTSGDLVSAQIGKGYQFDGVDDGAYADVTMPSSGGVTFECWAEMLSGSFDDVLTLTSSAGGYIAIETGGTNWRVYSSFGFNLGSGYGSNAMSHLAVTLSNVNGSGFVRFYINGVQVASTNYTGNFTSLTRYGLGYRGYQTNRSIGAIGDESKLQYTERTSDWISEEYSQTNDNPTFWGTWTNVPVGTQEVIIEPTINETESITASLLSGKYIIATVNESEQITTSLLIYKIISATINESEAITATLLTESTVQEVEITAVVNESEVVTSLLLSAKEISPVINESEVITADIKNRLPITVNVNEAESIIANLIASGSIEEYYKVISTKGNVITLLNTESSAIEYLNTKSNAKTQLTTKGEIG